MDVDGTVTWVGVGVLVVVLMYTELKGNGYVVGCLKKMS